MSAIGIQEEIHIASFVVQHRADAIAALAAAIAPWPGLELALSGDTRSVVLCESADRHAVMAHVERLRGVSGVLNVLLVYHHAEPGEDLSLPAVSPDSAVNGASA